MAINPDLATLMRVIEEYQDKMPEGEYLLAMNALGALHRQQEEPPQALIRPIPVGPTPANDARAHLFASPNTLPMAMAGNINEQRALERVKTRHPDPFQNRLSPEEWVALSHESRYQLLREANEHYVTKRESFFRNPSPEVCTFITRHSFGLWDLEDNGQCRWECVCGYIGKVKHWKKHEQSERHQDWAKHRTVSRLRIKKMKAMINDDQLGVFVRYVPDESPNSVYPGGIRFYPILQDQNEWTHPELFATHLSPMKNGQWFVHLRINREKEYE